MSGLLGIVVAFALGALAGAIALFFVLRNNRSWLTARLGIINTSALNKANKP